MTFYKFTILGQPVAKARPRVTKTGHVYTPQKTIDFERKIALKALEISLPKLTKPLEIEIDFIFTRPQRIPKKQSERVFKETKPDIDNCIKAVLDGLKVSFDDKLVCRLTASKYYASINEQAKTIITIRGME